MSRDVHEENRAVHLGAFKNREVSHKFYWILSAVMICITHALAIRERGLYFRLGRENRVITTCFFSVKVLPNIAEFPNLIIKWQHAAA